MGGLFDKCIVGDADTVMMAAFAGDVDGGKNIFGSDFTKDIIEWQQKTGNYFNKSFGFVPGAISHHWHGLRANRNYIGRRSILKSKAFPYRPSEYLYYDNDGLLRFRPSVRDYYNPKIMKYFQTRDEDNLKHT
jgi:hypothetical protein